MKKLRKILVGLAFACILGDGVLHAQAPDARTVAQIYADGMKAFESGDFKTTLENLEKVIVQAAPDAQLESVFYTLGAAYFNLPDYPKAITAFQIYQTKYPKAARFNEGSLAIGQALSLSEKFTEAAVHYQTLENVPELRERALALEAAAYEKAGDNEKAIGVLERLVLPQIKSSAAAAGAIQLATLYGKNQAPEKASALLLDIQKHIDLVENVVQLNSLAIQLGDNFLAAGNNQEALVCYRTARNREEVIRFQNERLASMQKKLQQNLNTIRSSPATSAGLVGVNTQIRTQLDESKKLLDEFQKLPDFAPALLARLSRCYYAMGKKWESIVINREILNRYPAGLERETALYSILVAYSEVNRPDSAREFCDLYLKEFPLGANAETVAYLIGAMALQTQDHANAEKYFGDLLLKQPTGKFRDEMIYQLGNVQFGLGKFEEAVAQYQTYQTDFPAGLHTEEVVYRSALALLFAGKFEEAQPAIENYLARYPAGEFVADADYRIAVCKYGQENYAETLADCQAWEIKHAGNAQLGETLALAADALIALDRVDEALPVYVRSYKAATTDEVLNYSLFEVNKILTKKGDWAAISALFEEFVREKPDHPTVVSALYWIGRARVREGKIEEAKGFIADTIKKFIKEPNRPAVEMLLTQLAQICAKNKTTAADTDPAGELVALLKTTDANPTADARVLFAKSELARFRRQTNIQEKELQTIADGYKTEDLSPYILAQLGDFLMKKNQVEKAKTEFIALYENHPKSDYVDYAYAGLGEIAYQSKDYAAALTWFTDAINKIGATTKLKEATLGQAKTLLALGKDAEAKKLFEQVASVREWRGDATAFSVYSLGEIAFRQGDFAGANAFFQRVFVAYQRFLPWVAKAYIMSGESFERLGKNTEAIKTYQEMLRNEKLSTFSETDIAKKRLKELGAG